MLRRSPCRLLVAVCHSLPSSVALSGASALGKSSASVALELRSKISRRGGCRSLLATAMFDTLCSGTASWRAGLELAIVACVAAAVVVVVAISVVAAADVACAASCFPQSALHAPLLLLLCAAAWLVALLQRLCLGRRLVALFARRHLRRLRCRTCLAPSLCLLELLVGLGGACVVVVAEHFPLSSRLPLLLQTQNQIANLDRLYVHAAQVLPRTKRRVADGWSRCLCV